MLDAEGMVIKTISPGWTDFEEAKIISRSDHACFFLNRGSWSGAPALYNHAGDKIWKYKGTANGSVAGDFDGDGHLKFAVCDKGDIHLLNESGNEIWAKNRGWIWHAEIAVLEPGQKPELVLNGRDGDLDIFDENGNELARNHTMKPVTHFCLIPWPEANSSPAVLAVEDESLSIMKPSGKLLADWKVPECKSAVGSQAVWFQPTLSSARYLVVMVDVVGGAVLVVYDTAGKIVYEETRSAGSYAVAVFPTSTGQSLLVGGNGDVTKFTLKGPKV